MGHSPLTPTKDTYTGSEDREEIVNGAREGGG